LAIADLAGGDCPRRAQEAALALHADPVAQTETIGVQFLAAIRAIFDEQGISQIPTPDLLADLVDRDDTPAAEWWSRAIKDGDTKGPARRLANLLKPYGIEASKWGSGKNTSRGYRRADFEDAWSRYLPSPAPFQTGGLDAADAASTPPVPEGDRGRTGAPVSVIERIRAQIQGDVRRRSEDRAERAAQVIPEENDEDIAETARALGINLEDEEALEVGWPEEPAGS